MTPAIFAQLPNVQPEFLHQTAMLVAVLISSTASLGGLVVSIIALRAKRTQVIEPQPLQVREADKWATARELSDMRDDDAQQRGEIKSQIAALGDKVDLNRTDIESLVLREVGSVHNRVNDVLQAVAHLQGVVEEMRRNTANRGR